MELLQSGTTRREEKKERGNEWGWFSQMKTTLKRCGVWRNHEKEESLKGKAAEKDQTARETSGDCFSLEESTLLEKIEDVYENKISLRRVYEVKKVISEVKPGREGFNNHVRKLQHLWVELQGLRSHVDGDTTQEQATVLKLLASMESSYGWLVEMVLRGEQLPEMEEVCVLIRRAYEIMRDDERLTMSRSESSWKPTGSRSESFQKLTMSRSESSWRLTGSRSEGFRKKRRCRMLSKASINIGKGRKRVVGECSYSAYMGESVEDSGVLKEQEKGSGADDRITRKEWRVFMEQVQALAASRKHAIQSGASKPIVIDSGASHHMISDRRLISEIKAATGSVMIANGAMIPIEGVGKLKLFEKDTAAFYMPQFTSNLLSVKKATIDLDCQVVFRPDEVEFQDLKTGRVIGRGDSKNQLYHLNLAKTSNPFDSICLSSTAEKIDSITWHARLGHPHARAIELIIPNMSFNHLNCEACILGKHCRTVFPTSETTYEHCFDLVHSDVWTAPCMSRDSHKYFVTFIDEKSKYTWLTLLPSKDRVLEAFMNFQAYVSNQYNATVKVLRSDNGGEYISNAFKSHLAKHGIVHQTSCPYTPQQNGVAERKNRHLMEVARSMMFHANVPKRFWGDAVQTACYLINRVPTKILKNLSPFEVLNKSKPFIDHLRVFGCVCYVMTPGEQRNKLEAKSTKAMFIGYSITQKGYKCYDPEARRVMVSREVKFIESKGYYEEKEWENLKDLSQAPSDRATTLRVLLEKLGIGLSQDQESGRRESSNPTSETERTTPLDHERGNGTESHEQVQNQEDSGQHNQEVTQEVETGAQSSGDGQRESTGSDESGEWEGDPNGSNESGAQSSEDGQEPQEEQVQELRRSTRVKRDASNWVNTRVYYNAQAVEHPSQAMCSFAEFPDEHTAFTVSLDESYIPRTYEEAMALKEWRDSVADESGAMIKNETWYESELPKGKKAVTSKWVFTIKFHPDGRIERRKSRLVARGFTQTYGEDYVETFAPVAKLHTIRIVLSLAVNLEWDLWQMDVKNAFLQGELEDEVYMHPPPGLEHLVKKGNVLRLRKAIYGLKQSPRAWYNKLSTTLNGRGFRKSELDHTLFTLTTSSGIVVLLVYVDDIIITGSDKEGIKATKEYLKASFEIKDLGEMKYFLGIEICRSKEGLFMSQRKYVIDLLKGADAYGGKTAKMPMEDGYKVPREGEIEDSKPFHDPKLYRKLVGKLIYLTITRPDVCFAVNQVSQHMQVPKEHHWRMVERILMYLNGTTGLGVWMGCNKSTEVVGYCDADWAGDRADRRSTTGYCTFIGGNLVTWKSKKQKVVSCSSAEAEYRAMLKLTNELVWIKGILKHLEIIQATPMTMHCDNQAAIHIASNSVFHERTKHIEVDCHKVRQMMILGVILPCYTRSEDQLADVFTKAARQKTMESIHIRLGLIDLSPKD